MSIIYRCAEPRDFPRLIAHAEAMHHESTTYRAIPFEPDATLATLERQYAHGFLAVAEDGGEIVGGMGGLLHPYPFNATLTRAVESWLYVVPKRRGGLIAVRLVAGFVEWAHQEGACQVWAGMAANNSTDPGTQRLYHAFGFATIGAVFVKEFIHGH